MLQHLLYVNEQQARYKPVFYFAHRTMFFKKNLIVYVSELRILITCKFIFLLKIKALIFVEFDSLFEINETL